MFTKEYIKLLLDNAAAAHHAFEQQSGTTDPNWSDWYAEHIEKAIWRDSTSGGAYSRNTAQGFKSIAERTAEFTKESLDKAAKREHRRGHSDKHDL